MPIREGDIYWLHPNRSDTQPRIAHPQVVIALDADTVTVCALTTNMRKVSMPGNILLDADEANLPKRSIVEVSKTSVLPASALAEYVGALSAQRIEQIQAGIRFVAASFRE